jgi:hypothetical protein
MWNYNATIEDGFEPRKKKVYWKSKLFYIYWNVIKDHVLKSKP